MQDIYWLLRVCLRTIEHGDRTGSLFAFMPEFYLSVAINSYSALKNYFGPVHSMEELPGDGAIQAGRGQKSGPSQSEPQEPCSEPPRPRSIHPTWAQTASHKRLHKSHLAESPVLGPAATDLTAAPCVRRRADRWSRGREGPAPPHPARTVTSFLVLLWPRSQPASHPPPWH